MEHQSLHHHHQLPQTIPSNYMNPFAICPISSILRLRPKKLLSFPQFRHLCSSSLNLGSTHVRNRVESERRGGARVRVRVCSAQLKEDWLDSLSCPFGCGLDKMGKGVDEKGRDVGSEWVVGVDPDVSGALALLKTDRLGCSAQIFDAPHLKVMVGKRLRRRLDAKSIVQLIKSFEAPIGTIAYVEQSLPFPQDGKQGWWCGGFNYGIWIGVLVASGFSVVPVPSNLWKHSFELAGSGRSKDESRKLASELFPSLSPMLKRKKDHGRAEALLIAAYGKGATKKADASSVSHKLGSQELLVSSA